MLELAFGSGKSSVGLEDITSKVSEADILAFYLGITQVPCIINSPLREDKRPSFGLYTLDGYKIRYKDLSTKDSGGIYDLLSKMWGLDFKQTLEKIYNDIPRFSNNSNVCISKSQNSIKTSSEYNKNSELHCKVRDWRRYDLDYWGSYGISLDWLKYADIYPISHKIIIRNGTKYTFSADKYAYAYVERKEGKVTLKIYQPYNKQGYKWSNKHDNSVISLWTKVPEYGKNICICASLKDALCLWANTGIPCLSVQGEGYNISDTAIKELKRRYSNIFILFDNDKAGLLDAEKLASSTGFINIVLPKFEGGKDVSDLYFCLSNKQEFNKIISSLFKNYL